MRDAGVGVVVLSLTVERGVGMERKDLSYGKDVHTRFYLLRPFSEEVTALRLGARRRSIELYACRVTGGANPCSRGGGGLYIVRQDPGPPPLQGA